MMLLKQDQMNEAFEWLTTKHSSILSNERNGGDESKKDIDVDFEIL